MKKVFALAFVLIMGLVIFSGCDNMNNPIEPKSSEENKSCDISSNGFSLTPINDNIELGIEFYNNEYYVVQTFSELEYEFLVCEQDYVIMNPGYEHFIEIMKNELENSIITGFSNEQKQKVFFNKLNSVNNMLKTGNTIGAKKKIENDLLKILNDNEFISDDNLKLTYIAMLKITLWCLDNPEIDIMIPPTTMAYDYWYIEYFCVSGVKQMRKVNYRYVYRFGGLFGGYEVRVNSEPTSMDVPC